MDDIRILNKCSTGKGFDYGHAINYVTRVLSNMSGKGNAGKSDKGRERDSVHGRKADKGKGKPTKARKVSGSSHVARVDTNTILDIVQDAFVIYWQGEGDTRTTRRACRFALLHHWQASKGRGSKPNADLLRDYARHLDYMYYGKRLSGEFSDAIYDTILEWLETGASQSDVARHLGLSRQRVSDAIKNMRSVLNKHVDEYPDTIPQKPAKPIGPRPVGYKRAIVYGMAAGQWHTDGSGI